MQNPFANLNIHLGIASDDRLQEIGVHGRFEDMAFYHTASIVTQDGNRIDDRKSGQEAVGSVPPNGNIGRRCQADAPCEPAENFCLRFVELIFD